MTTFDPIEIRGNLYIPATEVENQMMKSTKDFSDKDFEEYFTDMILGMPSFLRDVRDDKDYLKEFKSIYYWWR